MEAVYRGERNGDCLKIKCYHRQEFVVCGYCSSEKNKQLSAILLGYYQGKNLIFAGKVGTGFSDDMRKQMAQQFAKLQVSKCPFKTEPKISAEKMLWLKPKLVAEIQFAELTKSGLIRQGSFVGFRIDKEAKNVVLEG